MKPQQASGKDYKQSYSPVSNTHRIPVLLYTIGCYCQDLIV